MNGYNIHANGIRHHLLHYAGTGPQLLLIPGITSPAITWGFIAERLTDRFDVHVLDVRGRGLSQAGDLDYSLDAMADDVLEIIKVTGMQTPVIMGHSMGARTAIRAACKDATGISGLILLDPPVSGPGRREYPSKWPWYEDSIIMASKGCTAEDMAAFCPTWTLEQRALRAEWLHTCQLDAIKTTFDGFHTDDIHVDLPHIKLPMRLVVAGNAPVIGDDDVAEIRTLAPHIDVRTVENAGHMIPWDNLDGFIDAVQDFEA
ncbi:MAG: alpha/beta hydrolase [Litoreibacter sp.]|uniref:alpha/beta fold hydrolase n=1 Tax=Litoreibacter sp. TaxID=1969459 RepID=UPI003299538C